MGIRNLTMACALLTVAPASAQQITPQSAFATPASADGAAIERFHAGRSAPLWIEGSQLSNAGRLLVERLRSAHFEGLAEGPALAAQIDASLASPHPLATDRLLSSAWLALAGALNGPLPGARYVDPALRPRATPADRTLLLAGQAPDLAAHVADTLRKSPIYEALRAAVIADAAARGGSPDARLVANLQRARILPAGGRYMLVNPAAAELLLVDRGEVQDRMRVVVGTRHTPTAPMVSTMSFAILNPYWNVAEDMVAKMIAPRVVRGGLAYLKRANYEAIDRYGPAAAVIPPAEIDWKAVVAGSSLVKLRQRPGPYNSMGRIKFPFPNDLGIFLHDTPNKPQFAKAERATSNGCVRLEDAPRLARWLFGHDPVATGSGGDQDMRLPQSVPIYIVYLTAQPTDAGVTWARDIYALDPQPAGAAI